MAATSGEDVPARLQRLSNPFALGYYYRLKVDENTALLDAVSGLHAALPDDRDFMKALKGIGFQVADPAKGQGKEGADKKRRAKDVCGPEKTNRVAAKQKGFKPEFKTFACGVAGTHVVAKPADSEDWRIVDMPEILSPSALAALSWDAADLPRPTAPVENVNTFQIRTRRNGEWKFQPKEYSVGEIAGLKRLHRFLKGKIAADQASGDDARKVGKPKNPDVRAFDCGLAGRRFVIKPAGPAAKGARDWRVVDRPAALLPKLGDLDWAALELPRHEGPVEKVTRFHIKRVADETWRFRPREYDGVRVGRVQRLYKLLRGDAVNGPTERKTPKADRQVFKDVVAFDCSVADGQIVMKPSEADAWSVVKKPQELSPAELATRPWATFDLPRHDGPVDKATPFQIGLHCSGEWKFKPLELDGARVGGLQRLCRFLKGDVQPHNPSVDALGKKLKVVKIGKNAAKKFPPRAAQKLQAIPAGSQIQIQRGKVASSVAVVGADGKVSDAEKTWDSVKDWALPYKTDNFRCGKHILVNGVKLCDTEYYRVAKYQEYVVVPPDAQMAPDVQMAE